MSNENRWKEICSPAISLNFEAKNCCKQAQSPVRSPIDEFLIDTSALLLLGTPAAITATPIIGRLILLGLVSDVEGYFKHLLARVVRLCPFSRDAASKQTVSFAAFDYYESENIEASLLEGISFATSGEIRKQTEKLTGIKLTGSEFKEAVAAFDEICQLRHAAVHTRGHLGVSNALAIGSSEANRLQVDLAFSDVQSLGVACHNIVRECNRQIFSSIVDRWMSKKYLSGEWENDGPIFSPIFSIFHCKNDGFGPQNAYNCYRSFRPTLIKILAGS